MNQADPISPLPVWLSTRRPLAFLLCLSTLGVMALGPWLWAQPAPQLPDPPKGAAAELPQVEGKLEPGTEEEGEEKLPARKVEIVKARMATPPGHRDVKEVRLFKEGAGRMDWSLKGEHILYDAKGEDGLYDLYLTSGTGLESECLTCEDFDLRKSNIYNPVWHPSGQYFVAQVQSIGRKLKARVIDQVSPRRGFHSELWAFTADGRQYWQLTKVGERGHAILDPHFSFEADHLLWSERMSNTRGQWGSWALRRAEFRVKRGLPRLGKVETLDPGGNGSFLVGHGFTPDDRGVLASGNLDPTATDADRDLFLVALDGTVERLTNSRDIRDEVAAYGPKGERIVWATDRNLPRRPGRQRLPWRHDLWIRSLDGKLQERLTFFNDPDSPYFLREALIGDLVWSPRGDRLLVQVLSPGRYQPDQVTESIYLLVFDERYRR